MSKAATKKTKIIFCIALTMLFLRTNFSIGQVNAYWQLGGNNSTTTLPLTSRINATSFVGSTDATLPFNIKTTFAQPVNFFTNNTQRMTILGTTGFVGIGTTVPSQKLEVLNGNINIQTSTNSYQISAQPVLWHKGNARNIFVGVGAGNNSVSAANNNSYFGYNAGFMDETTDCIIYNRWGVEVYRTTPNNTILSWDGNQMNDGVYYYYIKTETETYKGFIQLIR